MGLGTNHTTTTTAAQFIPSIWMKKSILATESNLVFGNNVWRLDAEVKTKGSTYYMPNVGNFSASTKSAETAISFSVETGTYSTLSIDTHKYCAFLLEDIVEAQSAYNTSELYGKKCGYATAKAVDTSLGTRVASLTQTVGTGGSDVWSWDDMIEANRQLDVADVPEDERVFIYYPDYKAQMLKSDTVINAMKVPYSASESPIRKRRFVELLGCDVYFSTNVYSATTSAVTTRYNVLMHKDCLVLGIQKERRLQSQYDINYLGTIYVADVLYGTAIFRDTFGVAIKS